MSRNVPVTLGRRHGKKERGVITHGAMSQFPLEFEKYTSETSFVVKWTMQGMQFVR